jgi:hypothetical protein
MIMQAKRLDEPMVERRALPRLTCDAQALPVFAGMQSRPAVVHNLSPGGIGVLIDFEVSADHLLRVELFNKVRGCLHVKLIQVVHVSPQGDGTWLAGGPFLSGLTDAEMGELLP